MGLLPSSVASGASGHLTHTAQIHKKLNGLVYDLAADGGASIDGTGNEAAAWQTAVDYLYGRGGGTLFVPFGSTGVSRITEDVVWKDNVHLWMPWSTLLQATKTQAGIDFSGADIWSVSGGAYTHDTAGSYDTASTVPFFYSTTASSFGTVRDAYFHDIDKQAINFEDPTGLRVVGCRFKNIGRGAVVLIDGIRSSVVDNEFEDTGDDCIAFNESSYACTASLNRIKNAGTLLAQGAGIKAHGQDIVISENVIDGCINGAIYVKENNGATSEPQGILIANNIVRSMSDPSSGTPTQAGIRVDELHGYCRVSGNRVKAYSATKNYPAFRMESGTTSAFCEVSGNDFEHDTSLTAAALISLSDCTFQRIEIRDNPVLRGSGGLLSFETDSLEGDLVIDGNHVRMQAATDFIKQSAGSSGIEYLQVSNNDLVGLTGDFIDLTNLTCTDVNVFGNRGTSAAANFFQAVSGVTNFYGRYLGSKTQDFASVADGAQANTTVSVNGARLGMLAAAALSVAVPAGVALTASVTASNTVTVTLTNHSGGAVDLASGTLRAEAWLAPL